MWGVLALNTVGITVGTSHTTVSLVPPGGTSVFQCEYRNLIPTNFGQPKFEDIWNQFGHLVGGGALETVINDFEKLFFMTQRCGVEIDNSITAIIMDIKSALFKEKDKQNGSSTPKINLEMSGFLARRCRHTEKVH